MWLQQCHSFDVRPCNESTKSEYFKKLTKNLILQNTFVKCEVLAHFQSITLACFHHPQRILQCSLQCVQKGWCVYT